MRKIILTAALALSAPLVPALAHGDEDHGGGERRGYGSHSRYHDRLEGAHERAHEDGFESRRASRVPWVSALSSMVGRELVSV